MTIEEFVIKTKELRDIILEKDPPLRIAAYTALAAASERIFSQGKNQAGQQLVYDFRKEIYVNPKNSPKSFKPQGKPKEPDKKGASKKLANIKFGGAGFSSGKSSKIETDRATKYFESYGAFKSFIGRPKGGSYVSFELFGDLKKDFENPKGKQPEPKEINQHEYVTQLSRTINQLKVENFNDKYGPTFGLSKDEIKLFYETAAFEFKRLAEKYA